MITMQRTGMQLLSILALLFLAVPLAAQEKPLRLVISSDLEKIYYVDRESAPTKPWEKFEASVAAERTEDPNAFLIDAGYSLAPVALMETGYGYAAHASMRSMRADAFHLTASDTFFGGSRAWGLPSIEDPEISKRYVGRLGVRGADGNVFTPRGSIEVERGGRRVRIVSLSDPARIAAWSGLREQFVFDENEALAAFASTGDANMYTIAISEMDQAVLSRIAVASSRPDLIISLTGKRDGTMRGGGTSAPIVSAPPPGSLLVIEVKPEDGSVTTRLVKYLDESKVAEFSKPPIPDIGVGIGNAATSLPARIGANKDNIQVQVLERENDADLTIRKRLRPFLVEIDGKQHRVWRSTNGMILVRPDGTEIAAGGVSRVDLLAVLDMDHKLRHVETRAKIAVNDFTLDLKPFFDSLYGKDPKDWFIDTSRYPGAEVVLHWLAEDLRKIIELDRRVYDAPQGQATPAGT